MKVPVSSVLFSYVFNMYIGCLILSGSLLLIQLDSGTTESTLGSFDIDLGFAERADLRGRSSFLFRLFQLGAGCISGLDYSEDAGGNDQEIDHSLNKITDHKVGAADCDRKTGEINTAADHADHRTDHIVYQRGDD